MHRSSPMKSNFLSNVSTPYPPTTTPQFNDKNSLPPPNYNLHSNPHNNLSSRPSELPPLASPPYIHTSTSSEENIFDNSSNNSPVHNQWSSTKLYAPTPAPMTFSDTPLTIV